MNTKKPECNIEAQDGVWELSASPLMGLSLKQERGAYKTLINGDEDNILITAPNCVEWNTSDKWLVTRFKEIVEDTEQYDHQYFWFNNDKSAVDFVKLNWNLDLDMKKFIDKFGKEELKMKGINLKRFLVTIVDSFGNISSETAYSIAREINQNIKFPDDKVHSLEDLVEVLVNEITVKGVSKSFIIYDLFQKNVVCLYDVQGYQLY